MVRLEHEETASNFISAKNMEPGDELEFDIKYTEEHPDAEWEEKTWDDSDKPEKQLKIPVEIDENGETVQKIFNARKAMRNSLLDAFGEDTALWNGAHVNVIVKEYPGFSNGFLLRPKGCRLPDGSPIPVNKSQNVPVPASANKTPAPPAQAKATPPAPKAGAAATIATPAEWWSVLQKALADGAIKSAKEIDDSTKALFPVPEQYKKYAAGRNKALAHWEKEGKLNKDPDNNYSLAE